MRKKKNVQDFFPKNNPITVGVYYYPEQWPESEWERDFKKMSELGFEFTHFGEFAWSKMEPTEGNFEFDWLDKAITLASQYKLKVILCTPSPTPPAWLVAKHPEILMQNEHGKIMQHGSRQQASWSSKVYREYVEKIVAELGKRYGKDPRIWGWQLDNEPSHYGFPYDYCPSAQENFRQWLLQKYQNIDSLNIRWGNSFWSQNYNSFDQIRIPNAAELVQPANPHALLDFQEFTNAERGIFLGQQAKLLRQYILPNQFITTNYMMQMPHNDPWVNQSELDFASYTNYPVNSYSEVAPGDLGFRLGSGRDMAISHDFFQSVNGITGIMELQPGQVNWGRYNTQPLPGAVRMWILHNFALGSKFICTYRFRQPLFGNEQYHQGIMQTDGISTSRGGEEFVRAIQEINAIKKEYTPLESTRRVGILWDHRSMLDLHNFPHNQNWNGVGNLYRFYETIKSLSLPVEFIPSSAALDPEKNPVILLPSIQLINDSMLSAWINYVKAGGILVIAPRTGQKNRDGQWWKNKLQEKLIPLIGASIPFYDHLPPSRSGQVKMNTSNYAYSSWGEIIEANPKDSVQILASYDSEFYRMKAAVIKNDLKAGSVFYLGVTTQDFELEKEVVKQACILGKLKITPLPKFVYQERRGNLCISVNYSSETTTLELPKNTSLLMGSLDLKPGEVVVWKTTKFD
jgi:beta-galactosidase